MEESVVIITTSTTAIKASNRCTAATTTETVPDICPRSVHALIRVCFCPQAWLKERWCRPCSAATGCLSPTTVPQSSTRSWCPAGRTNLKTGPPLITCRVSWMTSTPPQRDSTSNSPREGRFQFVKTFFTFTPEYIWSHSRYVF